MAQAHATPASSVAFPLAALALYGLAAAGVLPSAAVAVALLPVLFGAGAWYFAAAAIGGAVFLTKSWRLARRPNRKTAMASFFASLFQLSLVLAGATLDGVLR